MEDISELVQRPDIRKHLSIRQLNVVTSLAELVSDVRFVVFDLRKVWNDAKGNRP
jgi:hypothetical protein